MSYRSGAHTKHRLKYHIVGIPKDRKRVLEGAVVTELRKLLHECAMVNDWSIEELGIESDHVHLLVQLSPKWSVSAAVQRMKGGTSRKLRTAFPELEEFLWGDSFWADGFFAETVGVLQEEMIHKYIREQRLHHAEAA